MQNLEQLGRELEKRGKTADLQRLAQSDDGQRISRMVDSAAVERAAKSGDSEALKSILSAVLSTEEGKRLTENVRRMMEK